MGLLAPRNAGRNPAYHVTNVSFQSVDFLGGYWRVPGKLSYKAATSNAEFSGFQAAFGIMLKYA